LKAGILIVCEKLLSRFGFKGYNEFRMVAESWKLMAKARGWLNPYNPVCWGAVLFVCGCLWLGAQFYIDAMLIPVGVRSHSIKTCVVTVRKGASLREIGDMLQSEQMITSSSFFVFYAQLTGAEKQIEAGSYQLSNSLSMKEILEHLVGGDVLRCRVVIPEGYTTDQIGKLLVSKKIVTSDEWRNELATENFSYPFLEDAPAGPKRLDGFLFPATYDLASGMTPQQILEVMLNRFDAILTPDLEARAQEQHLSIRQVIILASIVEREAKLDSERPVIASVFLNRLHIGMRLESDATVQYALGATRAKLTAQDVRTPSPYNTYLHDGLPPGPISNPGLASIRAVLYPANTNYLFFMGKGDGSHVFSVTYAEHVITSRQYGQ
jgi:UPF0755 protein